MKHIKTIAAVFAVALLIGCASQSRVVYNTLASVQAATTSAYDSYLSLVVKGVLTTNAVPAIAKDYNTFQLLWSASVTIAQFNTNTVAPQSVIDASTKVVTAIAAAKGQ